VPLTRELTVAGVLLHKHAGADGYHFYRGTLHGLAVTLRPNLGRNGKPLGWKAYAKIAHGALAELEREYGPSCVASGESLELTVRRADYTLGQRAERRKTT
jgi:hypothetical protein